MRPSISVLTPTSSQKITVYNINLLKQVLGDDVMCNELLFIQGLRGLWFNLKDFWHLSAFHAEISEIWWSPVIMKSCASAFIVQNKCQEDITGHKKLRWLICLAAISISPRKWIVQKHLSPQLPLQPHSIAYVRTSELWCGLAWQMT